MDTPPDWRTFTISALLDDMLVHLSALPGPSLKTFVEAEAQVALTAGMEAEGYELLDSARGTWSRVEKPMPGELYRLEGVGRPKMSVSRPQAKAERHRGSAKGGALRALEP